MEVATIDCENAIEFVALLSPRSTVTGYEIQVRRGQHWAYFLASEDYISGSKDICTLAFFYRRERTFHCSFTI